MCVWFTDNISRFFFFYISKRVDGKRQDGAEEKNEVRGSRLFLLSV